MSVLWIKNVKFSQSFQRMYILPKKMRPVTSDNIKMEPKYQIKDWKENLIQQCISSLNMKSIPSYLPHSQ